MALLDPLDNWLHLGHFASFAYIDLMHNIWPALLIVPVFLFVATALLLSISTLLQFLVGKESLWGHMLLCGGAPFLLFLSAATRLEELVITLSISGMAVGLCWWFVRRRQQIFPAKHSRPPNALWGGFAITALLLGLAIANSQAIYADEASLDAMPTPDSLGSWIIGGSATENRLVLLNGQGQLVSYDRMSWRPTVLKKAGVIDFRQQSGSIWVLSTKPAQSAIERQGSQLSGSFLIERFANGSSRPGSLPPEVYPPGERPVGLAMAGDDPIVISPRAIYQGDRTKGSWHRLTLSEAILADGATSVSSSLILNHTLYVGLNAGEWGGGLVSIDLRSGKTELLDRRSGSEICDGPLHSDCDPVTGLVHDPARPNCLLASLGLSHMRTHGRIVRICGREIDVIFERTIESPMTAVARKLREARSGERRGPMNMEAFFGMIITPQNVIWAIGLHGLYRYDGRSWHRQQLPELKPKEGFMISEQIPGLLLLSTDRNAPVSLSGSTPMLVATSEG